MAADLSPGVAPLGRLPLGRGPGLRGHGETDPGPWRVLCVGMSWDVSGLPHRLAERRSGVSELEPDQLPEVRELGQWGWSLAPDAPMWVFLPYVWPPGARTWVPDRSTRWQIDTTLDATCQLLNVACHPVSQAERETQERDADADLARVGIPPRPAGRVWLLRPVGEFKDVEGVLDHLCASAEARGVPVGLSAEFAELCAEELRGLAVMDDQSSA